MPKSLKKHSRSWRKTSLPRGRGAAAKGLAFKSQERNGVTRIIRTCTSAFARGGSAAAGAHGLFKVHSKEFLKSKNFNSVPLVPFHENRCNILFFDAGFIYFLHEQMLDFLEKNSATNPLLKPVHADLQEPFYIAGCKTWHCHLRRARPIALPCAPELLYGSAIYRAP